LVAPDNLVHLLHKQVFQAGVGAAVLVNLVLGQHAAKLRLLGVGEQGAHPASWITRKVMSSKSSRPEMVLVRAVVLPPVNRLSRSFSSFTSIIERMALPSRSEYT